VAEAWSDQSPPSSPEVKNVWSYTSSPYFVYMGHCLITHRDCVVKYISRISTILDELFFFSKPIILSSVEFLSCRLSPKRGWSSSGTIFGVVLSTANIGGICRSIPIRPCYNGRHSFLSRHWFRMQIRRLVRRRQSVAMETIGCHWEGEESISTWRHTGGPQVQTRWLSNKSIVDCVCLLCFFLFTVVAYRAYAEFYSSS
jgi:hypothetical protein